SVLQKTPSEREGRVHYIYAALQTESKTVSLTLEIEPNHPLRHFDDTIVVRCDEEYTNSLILLNLIAEGCGLQERADLGIPPSHIRRTESTLSEHHVSGLLTGKWQSAIFDCHPFALTGPMIRSN